MLSSTSSSVQTTKKRKILGLSLDYDGSYCFYDYGVIANHSYFHQFIFKLIREGGYDEVEIMVGSLRQTRDADVYTHTACFSNGSITQTMPFLFQILKDEFKNTSIIIRFNKWLLEDVVMGFTEPQQFDKHKAFVDYGMNENQFPILPRHFTNKWFGESEASKQFYIDHDKTSIILFQTHLLNRMHPDAEVDYILVDDMAYKFGESFSLRNACAMLVPKNTKAKFAIYVTNNYVSLLNREVCGIGQNCLDEIMQEMQRQVVEHQDVSIPAINVDIIIGHIRNASNRLKAPPPNLSVFSTPPSSYRSIQNSADSVNHSDLVDVSIAVKDSGEPVVSIQLTR